MKYGLSDKQLREIVGVISAYSQIESALIFGSRAIDTYKEASDVDIAIKGSKANSKLAATLKDRLEEETYLPFFFDVIAYNSVQSEELKKHVRTKGKTIYSKGLEGWREVRLGEVMRIFTGRKDVNQTNPNGKYRFFSCSPNFFLSDEYIADSDALIITGNGSYTGTVRFFSGKFDLYQRTYACILNEEASSVFETMFIYYYAKIFFEKKYMGGTRGSSIPYIVKSDIENFAIPKPPLPEQKAIAEVLSGFDDKIDLLHRQNKTLEDMAQALFHKWFVEEADAGWAMGVIENLCYKINSGGTPATKINEYYGGNINWYSTKELNDNFLLGSDSKITEKGLKNSSAKLFPKNTVIIAIYASPTVGRLGLLSKEGAFNQAACGLIADEQKCCHEFLYLYLKSQRKELNAMASGSAQQNLNVSKIKNYPVFMPSEKAMKLFKCSVRPAFEKIEANTHQICTLENLRNDLLPKLMSGEVKLQTNKRGY